MGSNQADHRSHTHTHTERERERGREREGERERALNPAVSTKCPNPRRNSVASGPCVREALRANIFQEHEVQANLPPAGARGLVCRPRRTNFHPALVSSVCASCSGPAGPLPVRVWQQRDCHWFGAGDGGLGRRCIGLPSRDPLDGGGGGLRAGMYSKRGVGGGGVLEPNSLCTRTNRPELICSTCARHNAHKSFRFRRERIGDSACLEMEEKVYLKIWVGCCPRYTQRVPKWHLAGEWPKSTFPFHFPIFIFSTMKSGSKEGRGRFQGRGGLLVWLSPALMHPWLCELCVELKIGDADSPRVQFEFERIRTKFEIVHIHPNSVSIES